MHNLLISFPVSFSSEFTFPRVRVTQFIDFIRVSFSSEFSFLRVEVHRLVNLYGIHSQVSSLFRVCE